MSSVHISYGRRSSGVGSAENLAPKVLSRVARELRALHKEPPEGVRLVIDSENPAAAGSLSELVAEIAGPVDTPYEGKFFQLKLCLPSSFPSAPPRGFFLTKIYHPNVDMSTGSICVNTLKRDWTEKTTLSHVLSVIRCLMIIPFPESSLNDEAGKFFMESYDEYARRAKLMADVHGRPRACKSFLAEKVEDGNGALKDDSNLITNNSASSPLKMSPSSCGVAEGDQENCNINGSHPTDVDANQDVALKKAKKDAKQDKSKTKKKRGLKRL